MNKVRNSDAIMMDIHTHILPGVDDGVQSYEEALAVLKAQRDSGITQVVITPHVHSVAQKVSSKTYQERFEALKKQIAIDLPEMTLYLGFELRHHQFKKVNYADYVFQGFKKPYILMEFSWSKPDNITEVIYDLVAKGFVPIVAHIERYDYLSLEEVKRIKSYGAIIQINSGAVLGLDPKRYNRLAHKYLKEGLVDIIASDCHNMDTRRPNLVEALQKAPKGFKNTELEV